MNEIYVEQIVKRKPNSRTRTGKALVVVFAAVLVTFAFVMLNVLLSGLGVIVSILILWGAHRLYTSYNLEFEYVVMSGDLDIDKILNKSRRGKVLSVDLKRLKLMAPALSDTHKDQLKNYEKQYNCTSEGVTQATYAAIFEVDKEIVKVLFDPNEELLKAIKQHGHRKVFEN